MIMLLTNNSTLLVALALLCLHRLVTVYTPYNEWNACNKSVKAYYTKSQQCISYFILPFGFKKCKFMDILYGFASSFMLFFQSPLPWIRGLKWGEYVGSPSAPDPVVCFSQPHGECFGSLLALPTRAICGLSCKFCLMMIYSKEQGRKYAHEHTLKNCTQSLYVLILKMVHRYNPRLKWVVVRFLC